MKRQLYFAGNEGMMRNDRHGFRLYMGFAVATSTPIRLWLGSASVRVLRFTSRQFRLLRRILSLRCHDKNPLTRAGNIQSPRTPFVGLKAAHAFRAHPERRSCCRAATGKEKLSLTVPSPNGPR